jgi:high-affinity iron transporter
MSSTSRLLVFGAAAAVGLAILAQAVTGGVADPTAGGHLSSGAVVFNSALLVFREGLESILVLAALTASMATANQALRRPVAAGAGLGLALTVVSWFAAAAVLDRIDANPLDVQAATGLLAVVVLVIVMNWFFHRVYWTAWIQRKNTRKKELLGLDADAHRRRILWGFVLLGFASVYREGFEVVLFLQSMRLGYGSGIVGAGVAVAAVLIAAVGLLTFRAHRRLPYRRMLVLTGAMLGVVLVVMVGEQVQEMQLAGWIGTTDAGVSLPAWLGTWFAVFPTVQGLVAQAAAAVAVIGSYLFAEHVQIRRPRRLEQAEARRVATGS